MRHSIVFILSIGLFHSRPVGFDREQPRRPLARLAAEGIHVDMSSWKYSGWRGQLCEEARERREKAFLHVNNRLESNALETIPGILALARV